MHIIVIEYKKTLQEVIEYKKILFLAYSTKTSFKFFIGYIKMSIEDLGGNNKTSPYFDLTFAQT